MLLYLFLLFTLLPIVELSILVWIGSETVWWLPILLVIATGIAGAALARWQGWQVLQRIREDARAGRIPASALIDGFLILLAGVLLVTPGVITDIAGIALLIPPIRALVKRAALLWLTRSVEVLVKRATAGVRPRAEAARTLPRDEIIDAQVVNTRVEDVH